ncbi:MAG: arylsulfatase [Planctomycetota bacterium]|jgi:arylsulfatase A-like enzyme|nr:arylsulfatase [Planctomycetota bacterium]
MMPKQPNILFIICDDLAWGDLSCHGNPHISTPHLDQMRATGTSLSGYRSGPLCTPARACLMTGRYQQRTRAIDTYCGRSMIDPSERTLAQVLGGAGYRTGLFGKWHLGDCHPMRPCDLGFDDSLWHRGGGIGQQGDHPSNHAKHAAGGGSYFNPVCCRGTEDVATTGYCTDVFTDAAIEFVSHPHQAPFFAYLAFNAPHTPLEVGAEWAQPFLNAGLPDKAAQLYGMVANIDHNVGRIIAALDQHGLSESTLLVFTSDHGPCGSAKINGKTRWNADLRDYKGSLFEGGVRVPCLLRWPGTLQADHRIDAPTHPIDWLPSFAALCGAETPTDRCIDGVDLSPALLASEPVPERDLFFQWHRGDTPEIERNAGLLRWPWKWYSDKNCTEHLFNLSTDPLERHNLIAAEGQRADTMRADYRNWFTEVGSERCNNYDPPPITVGGAATNVRLSRNDWRVIGPDGWSENERGRWWITAPEHGRFTVSLSFDPGAPIENCCLAVDAELYRGGTTQTIDLAAGPHLIEAWCTDQKARRSALYVELSTPD